MQLKHICKKDYKRWEANEDLKNILDEFEDLSVKNKIKDIVEKSFVQGFFCGVQNELHDECETDFQD